MVGMGIVGERSSLLALAVAEAVDIYVHSLAAQATCMGVVGGGSATGNLLIPPSINTSLITNFVGNGIIGQDSARLASAIGTGVMSCVNSTAVIACAINLGAGGGVAKLVGVSSDDILDILLPAMVGHTIAGERAPLLARAVAGGVAEALNMSISPVVVVGSPVPPFNQLQAVGSGGVI